MPKKKVLIHTDHPLALTGFGKNSRNILEYLYKTDKYELYNLAVGSMQNAPDLNRTPWKTIGTINQEKIQQINNQNDPKSWESIGRMAGYGAFAVDEAIQEIKPDVYIAIQDIWGIDYAIEKPWFDKITSALWTTLDSLPILDKAVAASKKSKHFWSWADFATKALRDMGHGHVKTVRGSLITENFYRLSNQERSDLRKTHNILQESFIIGFVFRNQLRKSVFKLIEGFRDFKNSNPQSKAKLLLHTSWAEGWDIKKFIKEYNLDPSDILTTYVCRTCGKYEIKPFVTNEENCRFCKANKSQVTTSPGFGVNEKQLNEIYNLMDVYCHPFTSGGQEIPIQEAKLTELITLVTNYSCGEDSCEEGAYSLPLDWAEYREPDTQFIKAATSANSITKQLTKVYGMKPETRREMGKKSRQWVINNFSIEVIGKFLEEFIDSAPKIEDYSIFDPVKKSPNPYYQMPEIENDGEWILHMYHNILDEKKTDQNDDGFKHWMGRINKELSRAQIEQFFRQVAFKTNQENNNQKLKFEDFLNPNDKGRVIVVQPEGAEDIFLITSLFKSIKETYPEWALYVSTKRDFKDMIDGNPLVDKWIEYIPIMDNIIFLEGNSSHQGFFNVAYLPYINTQKIPSFMHNGQDKINFNINAHS